MRKQPQFVVSVWAASRPSAEIHVVFFQCSLKCGSETIKMSDSQRQRTVNHPEHQNVSYQLRSEYIYTETDESNNVSYCKLLKPETAVRASVSTFITWNHGTFSNQTSKRFPAVTVKTNSLVLLWTITGWTRRWYRVVGTFPAQLMESYYRSPLALLLVPMVTWWTLTWSVWTVKKSNVFFERFHLVTMVTRWVQHSD